MKSKVVSLLSKYIEHMSSNEIFQLLEVPPRSEMGDFAFPCFVLAKEYRKAPPVIASDLAVQMQESDMINEIEKVEVQGGYLNFFMNREALVRQIVERYDSSKEHYGSANIGHGQAICIDYSSPNVAKNFHVGHLRTTLIGNSIYKIFNKLGYKVERINHLGDWGTQFGKLIVAYRNWGTKEDVEKNGISELMKLYVRFHDEAKKNDELNDEARSWFTAMEQGNEEALGIWKWFRELSLNEYMQVYDILGIEFDSFAGESFYNDKMASVIQKLHEQNLLQVSDGAQIVDLEDYNMPPCLITKKDGSTLYATRDISAALYRKKRYNFVKCIYVTGVEQKLHFSQFFKVIDLMGYNWADQLIHVPYGLVSLPEGKVSTRNGNIIYAEDILNESIQKIKTIILEKKSETGHIDIDEVARQVGIGAIVFNDLYNQRIKEVVFNWDKILNPDGETGPYAQYTHARACSVIRKVGMKSSQDIEVKEITDDASIALLKELERYEDVIVEASERFEPSVIARYIIAVAHAFNKFYEKNKVNVDQEEVKMARLKVVEMTKYVLQDALSLLGMAAPEQI